MLVKFEQNRIVLNTRNFELPEKKKKNRVFKIIFWQSVDAILEMFLLLKLLFNAKLVIRRLPFFSVPKITAPRHVWPG